MGALIGRIDRGAGGVTDSAIDAMGDRLTVGGAWTIPTVRGDVAGLLNTAGSAITDAYRYDPFGVSLASAGSSTNPYRFGGRLLESTSGQYDFGARQYDPAIGAFTSLDTVMGQAQNPLSLNRYLYALANPGVLIDPDGHMAIEYDGIGKRYENAVADARAAVTAARTVLNAAASAYGWATAAANYARGRLSDPCPLTQCPGREDRVDWRQSRLDAYTAAVTIRDAARARYDAAASAYASAEAHLRAAVAQLSKRSGTPGGRAANAGGGPDDRGGGRPAVAAGSGIGSTGRSMCGKGFCVSSATYGTDPATAAAVAVGLTVAFGVAACFGTGACEVGAAVSLVTRGALTLGGAVARFVSGKGEAAAEAAAPVVTKAADLGRILLADGELIGEASRSDRLIRNVVGGADAAQRLFAQLTQGASRIALKGYDGTMYKLPGGGWVGWRDVAGGGLPAIDFNAPGWEDTVTKFHFLP